MVRNIGFSGGGQNYRPLFQKINWVMEQPQHLETKMRWVRYMIYVFSYDEPKTLWGIIEIYAEIFAAKKKFMKQFATIEYLYEGKWK